LAIPKCCYGWDAVWIGSPEISWLRDFGNVRLVLLSKSGIQLGKLQRQLLWQCFRYWRWLKGIIDPGPQIAIDKQLLA